MFHQRNDKTKVKLNYEDVKNPATNVVLLKNFESIAESPQHEDKHGDTDGSDDDSHSYKSEGFDYNQNGEDFTIRQKK